MADKLENFTANDDFEIFTKAAQAIRALNGQIKRMQFEAAGYETIDLSFRKEK